MRSTLRLIPPRKFPAAVLALLFISVESVDAHMPWLATNDEQQVVLWFGESPDDRVYPMPEKVAAIELHAGKDDQPIAMEGVEEDDFVGRRSKSGLKHEDEISGSVTYGLYHGMKLTYHVEHLPGKDPSSWPEVAREDSVLQTVIAKAPEGGVLVTVLKQGQPISNVEVKLFCEEGHEDSQTTDSAGMVTFGQGSVEAGLNAILVGITDEQSKGELHGEAYSRAADYLTATFFYEESGSPEGSARKPKLKVDENQGASIQPSGLPDLPEELTSFGAAFAGNQLFVYGGHTGSAHSYSIEEQSDRFWCLDLDADGDLEWKKLASGPRLQGLALVAHGHDLIRIGGFTAMNETGEEHDLRSQALVAQYSPSTGRWTELPALPEPRSSFDAAVLNDRVFVFGGWQMNGANAESVWHDTAWSLDLSSKDAQWKPLAKPGIQRRAISVAAHDDKLYVVGGMQAKGGPTTRVDVYDPANDTWTRGPDLPGSGMSGFGTSAFACDGDLYVSAMDGLVHRLNASGNGWDTIAKADPARFFHRMVPQGRGLLMIGGANMEVGKFTEIDLVVLGE